MAYTGANLLELVPFFFFFHASGISSNNIKLKIVSGKITFSQIVKNSTISEKLSHTSTSSPRPPRHPRTHTHSSQISNEGEGERQSKCGVDKYLSIYVHLQTCFRLPVVSYDWILYELSDAFSF